MYASLEKDEIYRLGLRRALEVRAQAGFAGDTFRLLDMGGLGETGRIFLANGIPEKNLTFFERVGSRSHLVRARFPKAAHCHAELRHFPQFHEHRHGQGAGIEGFNWDLGSTPEPSARDLHAVLPVLKRGQGPRVLFAVMADARRNLALEDPRDTVRRAVKTFARDASLRQALEAFWLDLWGRYRLGAAPEPDVADPFKVALRELSALTVITGALSTVGLAATEAIRFTFTSEGGFRMRAFFLVLEDETESRRGLTRTLSALHAAPSWLVRGGQAYPYLPPPAPPEGLPTLGDILSKSPKEIRTMIEKSASPNPSARASAPAAGDTPRDRAIAHLREVLRHHDAETKQLFEVAIAPPPADHRAAVLEACNFICRRIFGESLPDIVFNHDGSVALREEVAAPVPVPAPVAQTVAPPSAAAPASRPKRPAPIAPAKKVGHLYLSPEHRESLDRSSAQRLRLIQAAREGRLPDEMLAILREEADRLGEKPPETLERNSKARMRLSSILARGQGEYKTPSIVSYLHLATDRGDFNGRLQSAAAAYGESTAALLEAARAHPTWVEPAFLVP